VNLRDGTSIIEHTVQRVRIIDVCGRQGEWGCRFPRGKTRVEDYWQKALGHTGDSDAMAIA